MTIFPLELLPTIPDDFGKKDFRDMLHWDMAVMHNCLFRSLNNIYAYADSALVANDILSFLTYIDAWAQATDLHHKGEEKYLFPELEKAGVPEATNTVSQHVHIHELVKSLEEFVATVKQDNSKYSVVDLRKILDTHAVEFHGHLSNEIRTLNPTAIRNAFPEEEHLKATFEKEIEWVVTSSNPVLMFPLILGAHDLKSNPYWPPIPAEVKKAIPGMLPVFQSSWRYSPFDIVTGKSQAIAA